MKIYHEIDPTTKLFVTDVFYEEQKDDKGVVTNPVTVNMIPDDVPSGLFHPKWDGKAWVEGNVTAKVKAVKQREDDAKKEKQREKDEVAIKSTPTTLAEVIEDIERMKRILRIT